MVDRTFGKRASNAAASPEPNKPEKRVRTRMSKLPTPVKTNKCVVAPPAKKPTEFGAKRKNYLEHWQTKKKFDSTATMAALAELTGHPDRPSLGEVFPGTLNLPRVQHTYERLRSHRELNDAIDETIDVVRRDFPKDAPLRQSTRISWIFWSI